MSANKCDDDKIKKLYYDCDIMMRHIIVSNIFTCKKKVLDFILEVAPNISERPVDLIRIICNLYNQIIFDPKEMLLYVCAHCALLPEEKKKPIFERFIESVSKNRNLVEITGDDFSDSLGQKLLRA